MAGKLLLSGCLGESVEVGKVRHRGAAGITAEAQRGNGGPQQRLNWTKTGASPAILKGADNR